MYTASSKDPYQHVVVPVTVKVVEKYSEAPVFPFYESKFSTLYYYPAQYEDMDGYLWYMRYAVCKTPTGGMVSLSLCLTDEATESDLIGTNPSNAPLKPSYKMARHNGMDFVGGSYDKVTPKYFDVNKNEPVISILGGEIVDFRYDETGKLSNYVLIKHNYSYNNETLFSVYHHLSAIEPTLLEALERVAAQKNNHVPANELEKVYVTQKQTIGNQGRSGISLGENPEHLHFGLFSTSDEDEFKSGEYFYYYKFNEKNHIDPLTFFIEVDDQTIGVTNSGDLKQYVDEYKLDGELRFKDVRVIYPRPPKP